MFFPACQKLEILRDAYPNPKSHRRLRNTEYEYPLRTAPFILNMIFILNIISCATMFDSMIQLQYMLHYSTISVRESRAPLVSASYQFYLSCSLYL